MICWSLLKEWLKKYLTEEYYKPHYLCHVDQAIALEQNYQDTNLILLDNQPYQKNDTFKNSTIPAKNNNSLTGLYYPYYYNIIKYCN